MKALFLLLLLLAPPRVVRVDQGRFQTAVLHFQDKAGARVDLVGAVHMAESAYYQALNKLFRQYDAVLYELVAFTPGDPNRQELYDLIGKKAPPANPIPNPGEGGGLSDTQRLWAERMGVSFQLDEIDYNAPNFVHADVSPAELARFLKGKKTDLKDVLERLSELTRRQKMGPKLNLLELTALFLGKITPQKQALARQFLAYSLLDIEGSYKAMHGVENTAYILKRNQKAMRVLKEQLKDGKKKIAVFYGAAHLPDMARSLQKDFGMRATGRDWLTAWKLEGNATLAEKTRACIMK